MPLVMARRRDDLPAPRWPVMATRKTRSSATSWSSRRRRRSTPTVSASSTRPMTEAAELSTLRASSMGRLGQPVAGTTAVPASSVLFRSSDDGCPRLTRFADSDFDSAESASSASSCLDVDEGLFLIDLAGWLVFAPEEVEDLPNSSPNPNFRKQNTSEARKTGAHRRTTRNLCNGSIKARIPKDKAPTTAMELTRKVRFISSLRLEKMLNVFRLELLL
mmetsp:Transcript_19250/g.33065  ORF Transcript_19250/g.33065 Transcript_19250/m.33065 type:complete len:219 (+) Transcript_19250:977-1633(+)